MTKGKQFIRRDESIINTQTDELVNASSEESAEVIVDWLNELSDDNERLKSQIKEQSIQLNFITDLKNQYYRKALELRKRLGE